MPQERHRPLLVTLTNLHSWLLGRVERDDDCLWSELGRSGTGQGMGNLGRGVVERVIEVEEDVDENTCGRHCLIEVRL